MLADVVSIAEVINVVVPPVGVVTDVPEAAPDELTEVTEVTDETELMEVSVGVLDGVVSMASAVVVVARGVVVWAVVVIFPLLPVHAVSIRAETRTAARINAMHFFMRKSSFSDVDAPSMNRPERIYTWIWKEFPSVCQKLRHKTSFDLDSRFRTEFLTAETGDARFAVEMRLRIQRNGVDRTGFYTKSAFDA